MLNLLGFKEKSQATLQGSGHNYDKLTIFDPASGKTVEMYFYIHKPFNWLQNSLKMPISEGRDGLSNRVPRHLET